MNVPPMFLVSREETVRIAQAYFELFEKCDERQTKILHTLMDLCKEACIVYSFKEHKKEWGDQSVLIAMGVNAVHVFNQFKRFQEFYPELDRDAQIKKGQDLILSMEEHGLSVAPILSGDEHQIYKTLSGILSDMAQYHDGYTQLKAKLEDNEKET